jgi:hypothetical protein
MILHALASDGNKMFINSNRINETQKDKTLSGQP